MAKKKKALKATKRGYIQLNIMGGYDLLDTGSGEIIERDVNPKDYKFRNSTTKLK